MVEATVGKQERAAIVDVIQRDEYPAVQLTPPDKDHISLIDLEFSEMSGRLYSFDIEADAEGLPYLERQVIFP